MSGLNRREFMKGSVGAAAGLAALPKRAGVAANEKIVVGVMGLGGRGTGLVGHFAGRGDCEIAYLCDADTRRFARAGDVVAAVQGRKPKFVQDFRRMLDDGSVDVVINATPDHWHGLGTIMACQAGKDVYVEKPMSHNVWEGRKMIEAARKYKRVVQVGMQTRSAPYMKRARDYIRSGKIGDVYLIRIFNMMRHGMGKPGADQAVPEGLDYDMWCGPAAKLGYNPSRRWLNYREYSCGPIAGDAVHQLDLARYLLGDPAYPDTVSNAGGVFSLTDGRDCADTQIATYEYGKVTMLLEAALWSPYMKKTPQSVRNSDGFPNWPFSSTKIEVCGTKGFVYVGRHGGGWQVYDSNCELSHSEFGRQADREHQDNFIDCVRTRKKAAANAEQGHYSVLLCHMANISGWVGNEKLRFDAESESFVDAPEANRFLKREYRAPWVVPDKV
jgi:predicted dehydrogenase